MELRDYHNNLAFRIIGDRCYDTKGVAVYVLKGNYFYDASGDWRLVIDGSRVYDSQGKWVYDISKGHGDRQHVQKHHASQPVPHSSHVSPQPDPYGGPQPAKSVYPSPQPNSHADSQSVKSPYPPQPGAYANQPQAPYASHPPVQNRYHSNHPSIQDHHHNTQPPVQSHHHSHQPHGMHNNQAPLATPPQQNYRYGHQPKKHLNLKVIIPIAVAVVLGVVLTIVLISGRGGTRSHPVVGQWHSTVDDYMMVIFQSDGTGVLFDAGQVIGFTWSADSGIMTAIFNAEGYIWREVHRYSLQGQLLHFTYLSGEDDELEWPSPWRRN